MTIKLLKNDALKTNFAIFRIRRKIAKYSKMGVPTDAQRIQLSRLERSLVQPINARSQLETAYPLGWEKDQNFQASFKN